MTNSSRNFVKIIKEICNELNIKLNSFGVDWIFQLTKNNKYSYIVGYDFPDISSSKKICDDKSALSEILDKHKIPNIKHVYFMNPKDIFYINEINWKNRLLKLFKNFNNNVVVKPNSGTSGDDVYSVKDTKNLINYVNKIFKKNKHVAISPFLNIEHEYRVIMYKNKSELIFDKKRVSSWKHNLASGSIPIIVKDNSLISKLTKLSQKATSLLNIKFASVDIARVNNKLLIMEINSGVMLEKFSHFSKSNYEKAKAIYKKVILDMFN